MGKRLTSFVRGWATSTSAHGCDRVARLTAQSNWRLILGLLWLAGVTSTLVILVVFISDRVTRYYQWPVSSTFSVKEARPIPFPAITVCSNSLLWTSRLDRFDDSNPSNELLALSGTQPHELMLNCAFAGRRCDGLHAEEWIHPSFGMCLTFNGGQRPFRVGNVVYDADSLRPGETLLSYFNERQARANQQLFTEQDLSNVTLSKTPLASRFARATDGLSLVLGVYPEQYLEYATEVEDFFLDWDTERVPRLFVFESAGLRVAVHERKKTPEMDSAIQMHPGMDTHMAFSKRVVHGQPHPWGNCSYRFWDNSTNTPADSGNYSVAGCELLCAAREVERRCGCLLLPSPRGFVPENASLRSCSSQNVCGLIVEEDVVLGRIGCPDCVEDCTSVTYSVDSSALQWPAAPSADVTIQAVETMGSGLANGTFANLSTDANALQRLRNNVLLARIYPQSARFETVTTSRAYSLTALLSDMGGQAGLWAGVSILTVGEFAEIIFLGVAGFLGCSSAFAAYSESGDDSSEHSKSDEAVSDNSARGIFTYKVGGTDTAHPAMQSRSVKPTNPSA